MLRSLQITQIIDMMTESNRPKHVYDVYTHSRKSTGFSTMLEQKEDNSTTFSY